MQRTPKTNQWQSAVEICLQYRKSLSLSYDPCKVARVMICSGWRNASYCIWLLSSNQLKVQLQQNTVNTNVIFYLDHINKTTTHTNSPLFIFIPYAMQFWFLGLVFPTTQFYRPYYLYHYADLLKFWMKFDI